MKLKCNCCDGIYNSFDIHFTSDCDNNCAHCIDKQCNGLGIHKPDVDAIVKTIVENQDGMNDVLFLGGEPCLYLEELLDCVTKLREQTKLKLYVTTSVPKICYDKYDIFVKLIEALDGINLSVQDFREDVADEIRKTKSRYDRQKFYDSLPYKDKIRLNLNIVKPFLCTKDDIIECLTHYDKMGFGSIKLAELQHGADSFISFENIFGVSFKSPYAHGCQTCLDMDKFIKDFKTPVILKRSCFFCEESLSASLTDGIKVFYDLTRKHHNKYGVIYENGQLMKGWV